MRRTTKTLTFFGMQVKKKLIELNMTQRELAKEIGINENYLTNILNGRRSGQKYRDTIVEKLNLEGNKKAPGQMKGVV